MTHYLNQSGSIVRWKDGRATVQWTEFNLDQIAFAKILSSLSEDPIDGTGQSTKEIGDQLEVATAKLWQSCGNIFRFVGSRQTYVGQIDGVVEVNTTESVLRNWGSPVIYECKNWAKPAGLPELAVLLYKMQLVDAHVGIMFSTHGITKVQGARLNGDGVILFARWNLNRFILCFEYDDLRAVCDGMNFIQLLVERYRDLQLSSPPSRP